MKRLLLGELPLRGAARREKPHINTTACKHYCIGGIHSGHATTNAREGLLSRYISAILKFTFVFYRDPVEE